MWAVGCNVTDGNYSHSLVVFNREQLLNCFNIVVAYPARAEITVSSSKAEVFNCNAKVDVAMIFVVVCAHPSVTHTFEAQHEHRYIGEPRTVVALPHLLLAFFRSNYQELPWLKVMC